MKIEFDAAKVIQRLSTKNLRTKATKLWDGSFNTEPVSQLFNMIMRELERRKK